MRIAMVAERAAGPAGHVAELSAAMTRAGHDVIVYALGHAGRPQRVETPDGYSVIHVGDRPAEPQVEDEALSRLGDFARRLDDLWSADRPDVAHAHSWMSGVATQLAAAEHAVPTVQTFHDPGLGPGQRAQRGAGSPARLKLERLVACNASWVAATCSDEVFELMRIGRARSRISVVPCGVDLTTFSTDGPVAPRGLGARIVAVGNMQPHMGFDTIIAALPAIPEAEFVIAGGPPASQQCRDPEVGRLRSLADQLGVADRVRFDGPVDTVDMPALLRSADVVACTPRFERCGVVALQAMACGVPVVALAVGATADTVVHDVTGRLVAPRRPRELAEAISAILRDSFLRRSLGLAGRDRACARYSWDRVSADLVRIYDRLAGSPVPLTRGSGSA